MRAARILLTLALLFIGRAAVADTLVLIVNPQSGVFRITRYQALDIFLGRYRKLPSGIGALPIDLDMNSSERERFYRLIARKDLSEINSYWARLVFSGQASPPFQAPDAKAAVDLVANNPSAIAYVDRSAVDSRVRVVLELTD
jgi:ABC-type phosphate transport system substrate-binding protein